MLFDVTVDESSNVACSTAGLVCSLRDAQSLEKLIEDFDRLLILGFCVGRIVWHRIHDVDGGHGRGMKFEGLEDYDGTVVEEMWTEGGNRKEG